MSKENKVTQQQELNQAELGQVIGGTSRDYLIWRKSFGGGASANGSVFIPQVGSEVIVGFESGDPRR